MPLCIAPLFLWIPRHPGTPVHVPPLPALHTSPRHAPPSLRHRILSLTASLQAPRPPISTGGVLGRGGEAWETPRTRAQFDSRAPRPPSAPRASSPQTHLASTGLPGLPAASQAPSRPLTDALSRPPSDSPVPPPGPGRPSARLSPTPPPHPAPRPGSRARAPAGYLPKPCLTHRPHSLPFPGSQRVAHPSPSPRQGNRLPPPSSPARLVQCQRTLLSPSSTLEAPRPLPDNRQGCPQRERWLPPVTVTHPRPSGMGASPRPLTPRPHPAP